MSLGLVLGLVAFRNLRRAATLEAEREQQERVRELERQLVHSERLASIGRLAAGLAHEINNPLEGVSNYLSLLDEDLAEGHLADGRATLGMAREGVGRAAGVLRQVLTFADPGRGATMAVDLREVLSRSVDFVRRNPEHRDLAIELALPGEPLPIEGNPVTLGQVFLNLLLNAAESGADGGAVTGLDALVTDLKMPGRGGLELVRELAEREPHLPVVVLTAYGTVGSAVECMQAGAFDYLIKPTDPDELALVLERALVQQTSRRELEYLRHAGERATDHRGPIGDSPAWHRVLELVEIAAPVDTTVLLIGESGTGKEEVAKLLHTTSPRSGAAFVRVNCAAIPAELFESEFFGHRKGAFTGAVADREGRFRVAHTGTLLLDEIDSLPLAAQAKVLRVIQDGEFERVGDSRPTKVDVRLVCSSNVDLERAVEAGRFRRDLYYRINVLTIEVPPLRERPEDVTLLAEAFLRELAPHLGRPVTGISPAAMEALLAYPWLGNVRELRNVVERAILVAKRDRIEPRDLPFDPTAQPGEPASDDLNLRRRLRATERSLLVEALRRSEGVRRAAAGLLGIDERNLAYYLKKHDLMGFEP